MDVAVRFLGVSRVHERGGGGRAIVALDSVTGEVPVGGSVAVVGRSGSGKSTLLHLAAAIDVPTSGTVELFGVDVGALDDRGRTRLRRDAVGLVFQFFHLLPHLSVLENVALPARIAGEGRRTFEPRARELLERVGMLDRARDPVDGLSGGEMQRVALCRALLRRPRLLLADEPTGSLDDDASRRVMDLLVALTRDAGTTLLLATHSREVASRADRVWRLHSGRLETS